MDAIAKLPPDDAARECRRKTFGNYLPGVPPMPPAPQPMRKRAEDGRSG